MPRNRLQQVTQHAARVIPRGKRVRHRIKRRKFGVAFQFLSKRHTGAPIARGATVIGKSVREVILEVIGSRQSLSTEAVNGCVSVVLVETGKPKNAVRADFSIGSDFLMQSALQNRPAVAHNQCREGVQLVKRSEELRRGTEGRS